VHGYISAPLAKQTGFSQEDLDLFWSALMSMFDHDRSAARGEMATQKLIVFKHDDALGNSPAKTLFELVGVAAAKDRNGPARSFSDYEVTVPQQNAMPPGVQVIEMV